MATKSKAEIENELLRDLVLKLVTKGGALPVEVASPVPVFAAEPEPKKKRAPRTRPEKPASDSAPRDWREVPQRCPKCGKNGHVIPDFGVRVVRGVVFKQSYCVECRSKLDYHNRPRRNKSQHNR